ncbi:MULTISPECIES: hypothetical protein [unclassified Amycolatopsis]|uniref:hypothetical protein n=1 Tax=unclassified Amycolatopsis TaxID=2618356 RepID=UPI002874064E|nr:MULTISPECIES: hypothetical protein [unclassified Amycolatopsis]MDS0140689.1 hypothetical protein [Amycolatopsis sp. 505]MDS0149339.1 hypothetical protein [Amycolatopsis sp. CM201R]
MKRTVSILTVTVAALLTAAPAALADDNPDWHAKCSTRVSPTEANNAEGWVNAQSDGGNWKIVNIYANLRNVGGKITGDHQVTVNVFNGPGGPVVASHKFDNIANGDITLTADVYPAVSIPKGKVAVQVAATTNISSWPKLCNGAGIVF